MSYQERENRSYPADDISDPYLGHSEYRGSDVILVVRDASYVSAVERFREVAEAPYHHESLSGAFSRVRRAIADRKDLTLLEQLTIGSQYARSAHELALANMDTIASESFAEIIKDYAVAIHEVVGSS